MELGSDFELDMSNLNQTQDNFFQYLTLYNTVYMDSGRSAAIALNRILKQGTILLPSYICGSVINVYKRQFRIKFYKINADFSVDIKDFEKKLDKNVTVVYITHYFGQLQDKVFINYLYESKKEYGFTIIEDTTHSIFTESKTVGDYCICSLRKWFPIMDGGVLYSDKEMNGISVENIPHKNPSDKLYAMILKHLYIEGKLDSNQLYRKIFIEEEKKLDTQEEIYQMSALSKSLMENFSISELKEKRKRNYHELVKALRKLGINEILKKQEFVPLCCPVYVENRDEFRKYLIEHQVYCAVHWPLEGTELEGDEEMIHISESIISFPIDQRYGKQHMQYLGNLIEEYRGKK